MPGNFTRQVDDIYWLNCSFALFLSFALVTFLCTSTTLTNTADMIEYPERVDMLLIYKHEISQRSGIYDIYYASVHIYLDQNNIQNVQLPKLAHENLYNSFLKSCVSMLYYSSTTSSLLDLRHTRKLSHSGYQSQIDFSTYLPHNL